MGFISNIMLGYITEYDRSKQYQTASNSNEVLNQQMKNIRDLCTQIKSDTNASYTAFLKGRDKLINVSDGEFGEIKKNIFENISMSVTLNSVIEDIYIFSSVDDTVIFSHGSADMGVMYGSLIKFGDLSFSEFRERYLTDVRKGDFFPAINVYNTGENTQSLLYVESYPAHPFSNPTGYIVVSIDVSELLNLLGRNQDNEIYLYSLDNRLIYSTLPAEGKLEIDEAGLCTINGNKYITYSSDNEENLNFISASLYNSALKKTITMRLFTSSILFCAVLIGLMLSVYFARANTKPIKHLMDKLQNVNPDASGDDEYTFISQSVDKIVNNIMLIEKDFEEERPALINEFVNSILIGKYMAHEEIEKIAGKLRVDISGNKFAVMIIEFIGKEAELNREQIRSIQKSISAEYRCRFNCLTNMNVTNCVHIIFKFDDEDVSGHMENIENVTYTVSDMLYESLNVRLKCAVGGFYNTVSDVAYSYESARGLLDRGAQVEYRNIVWCVQSDEARTWYYYPNEIEQRIENAFRAGDVEEIDHVLKLVKKENCSDRVLDLSTIRLLYTNMKITVHNIMRQYCPELDEKQMWKLVDGIDEGSGMNKFFEMLSGVYHSLIENNTETKSLKQEILEYMNKAALNVDFDRQMFAKRFFISPDYVSKFFKENTGEGFTKYAAKVRIDKACELLREDNYNIEKISEAVGYSSALSFRRAFKSYMGISPSNYRRKIVETDNEDI